VPPQRITVNGQAFSFTAFEDRGCDVYQRHGPHNTLLEDVGQVRLKCSVQRQLNAGEASRVKQRCEAAVLETKARKSVSLDPRSAARLQAQKKPTVVRTSSPAPMHKPKPAMGSVVSGGSSSGGGSAARGLSPGLSPGLSALRRGAGSPSPSRSDGVSTGGPADSTAVGNNSGNGFGGGAGGGVTAARAAVVLKAPEPLQSAGAAAAAAAAAWRRGGEKAAVRAATLVLLRERPFSLKALRKALDELPRAKAYLGDLSKSLEKTLKEMKDQQVSEYKAPGRYHLKPRGERELKALQEQVATDLESKSQAATVVSEKVTGGRGEKRKNSSPGTPQLDEDANPNVPAVKEDAGKQGAAKAGDVGAAVSKAKAAEKASEKEAKQEAKRRKKAEKAAKAEEAIKAEGAVATAVPAGGDFFTEFEGPAATMEVETITSQAQYDRCVFGSSRLDRFTHMNTVELSPT
jgi:hypothetical protein